MYEIEFYEDKNGKSEIADYIRELNRKASSSKESRVNFHKIIAYFDLLEEFGTRIGEPVTKHLDGDIWELRPLRNRFPLVDMGITPHTPIQNRTCAINAYGFSLYIHTYL